MSMYAHKHMNCPTCRCTDTINVNDIGEVIDPKQAEIDELKCELTILLKLSTVNMTDDHVKRVKKLLEK